MGDGWRKNSKRERVVDKSKAPEPNQVVNGR